MIKTNPTVVGHMRCECSADMQIRERSNGRKLLYSYCPECKLDQRSGTTIQKFWRENMVPLNEAILPGNDSVAVKLASDTPVKAPESNSKSEIADWSPRDDSEKLEVPQNGSDGFGLFVGGLVGVGLLVFGIRTARAA